MDASFRLGDWEIFTTLTPPALVVADGFLRPPGVVVPAAPVTWAEALPPSTPVWLGPSTDAGGPGSRFRTPATDCSSPTWGG